MLGCGNRKNDGLDLLQLANLWHVSDGFNHCSPMQSELIGNDLLKIKVRQGH